MDDIKVVSLHEIDKAGQRREAVSTESRGPGRRGRAGKGQAGGSEGQVLLGTHLLASPGQADQPSCPLCECCSF